MPSDGRAIEEPSVDPEAHDAIGVFEKEHVRQEQQIFWKTMLVLALILVWFGGLALMLALAAWVLGPLENAAKAGPRRLWFTLADWLCLIGLIQVWAAATHTVAMMAGARVEDTLPFDAYGWFLIVLMWLGVVRRLSTAGVRNAWHRSAALVLIYPLCVLCGIALVGFLPQVSDGPPSPWPLVSGIAVVAIVGLMFVLRKLVRAIAASVGTY